MIKGKTQAEKMNQKISTLKSLLTVNQDSITKLNAILNLII
jgi:hypothetical protein